MLNLDLLVYNKDYTNEEKKALEICFKQIQNYLRETIISKNPVRRSVEYRLGCDSYSKYSKSYLVIDCNTNQVYLRRNAAFYFTGDKFLEERDDYWKYPLCAAVVEHWSKIREELDEEFGDCQSVLELCESFSI